MKIASLKIRNYRTLDSVDLSFPSAYAAICGPNDSGKTNVVRAIRTMVKAEESYPGFGFQSDVSVKDDYPKWKGTEPTRREIEFELMISVERNSDAGFYEFIVQHLSLQPTSEVLEVVIRATYRVERTEPTVVVAAGGNEYADLKAQEVLKKLQGSKGILFHNSTQATPSAFFGERSVGGYIRELTGQHESLVSSMKKTVSRGLATISKRQQAEIEALLGRLQTKYRVGLSIPAFDFGYLPFSITLGERKFAVPLDEWGSGTKNRTLILLTLFRARQMQGAEPSAGKITPIIIIEEPESFLHPAAQAEFGRILQDLAEEFRVQVIVTTHSPYLLNMQNAESNILLQRRTGYGQLRDTECVETVGENWTAPFGLALGLHGDQIKPWKDLILTGSDSILLVEGDTDRDYFEMLRSEEHGGNRLMIQGEIVPYEGTGNLSNTILLRFIKNRFRRLFVTFDLDAVGIVERSLKALQLEPSKHYYAIGLHLSGKRNIEGLLPESVTTAVYAANGSLVQAATSGTKEEQESAKNRLKKLYLEEFKKKAKPTHEYFGHFYPIVKAINKALS